MMSEKQVTKLYNDNVEFLEQMDNRTSQEKADENIEAIESYEHAVYEHVLLHKILQIPGEPRWTY